MRFFLASFLFLLAIPVSAATDLAVFGVPIETRLPAGYEIRAAMNVWNFGPDPARSAVLELEVTSPDVQVSRVVANTAAECNYSARPVRCTLGDLPITGNDGLRFDISLTTTLRNAKFSLLARVTSATEDTRSENNTVEVRYEIVDGVHFYPTASFPRPRVDPGTTLVARAEVNNFIDSYPSNIRVDFSVENGTLQKIVPPEAASFTCTVTGPTTGFCTAPELNRGCRCSGPFEVFIRASDDRRGGVTRLTMRATSSLPEFEPANDPTAVAEAQTYRVLAVQNASDSGSGSLRAAIDNANAECGEVPCKIAFEIATAPNAEGWHTIRPETPLPPITAARVFVDGRTQTRLFGDTNARGPEIAIDGRDSSGGHGLQIESRCEAVVEGLAIGNFADHGLFLTLGAVCMNGTMADSRRVEGNYLGLDPSGLVAWPNLRGLLADGEFGAVIEKNVISGNRRSGIWMWNGAVRIFDNRIGTSADGSTAIPNGASGIFLGPGIVSADVFVNRIANHPQMGIAVDRAAKLVDIRENSMRDNRGLGIDVGLDGSNPPMADDRGTQGNPPVLLSARYDSSRNATLVMMSVRTGNLGMYGNTAVVSVYANSEPDEDGEEHLRTQFVRNTTGEAFELEVPGDHRGRWLNATTTRVHFIAVAPPDKETTRRTGNNYAGGEAQTSEFSNSVRVE